MRYGSLWRRAAAFVIDVGLYVLLCSIAIFGLDSLLDLQLRGLELRGSIFAFREFEMWSNLIMLVIKLVVGLLYFAGFEAAAVRATPGKLLLGLQVTDITGRRLSLGRAASRFLARGLSGATAGLGYFLAGFQLGAEQRRVRLAPWRIAASVNPHRMAQPQAAADPPPKAAAGG